MKTNKCTVLITSRSVPLRIKNISYKSCREAQDTHFMFSNFFRKSYRLWDNVENIVDTDRPQIIIWHMCIAYWIPKATHSQYVILHDLPLQQWLQEGASVLRYTYIACIVTFTKRRAMVNLRTDVGRCTKGQFDVPRTVRHWNRVRRTWNAYRSVDVCSDWGTRHAGWVHITGRTSGDPNLYHNPSGSNTGQN